MKQFRCKNRKITQIYFKQSWNQIFPSLILLNNYLHLYKYKHVTSTAKPLAVLVTCSSLGTLWFGLFLRVIIAVFSLRFVLNLVWLRCFVDIFGPILKLSSFQSTAVSADGEIWISSLIIQWWKNEKLFSRCK